MARTPEFEDMEQEDWPGSLCSLQEAARYLYYAIDRLDTALSELGPDLDERAPYLELWCDTYKLYRRVQAYGLAQIAELIRLSELAYKAENEEAEQHV